MLGNFRLSARPVPLPGSRARPSYNRSALALACLLACNLWLDAARAQTAAATSGEGDRDFSHMALEDTVFSRARPEFETEGLMLEDLLWEPLKYWGMIPQDAEAPALIGSARVFVNVTGETEYDDNVYRARNRRSDIIYRLRPSADIHSDWDNGSLSLQLAGDFAHYGSLTDEDYADISGKLIACTEVGAAGQLGGDLSLARKKEQRGAIEDLGSLFGPTIITIKEGALRAGYGFPDSLFGQVEGKLRQLTYTADGVDRSSDDRLEYELTGRGGWRSGEGSTLFIEPRYSASMYERSADSFGFQRDAKK
ncbi:MAG: hypothetical protein FJX35_18220 [Alphaproteobacteria bacterium]|nr:hypothetical protein [Alphaproteobacteria bacterium]